MKEETRIKKEERKRIWAELDKLLKEGEIIGVDRLYRIIFSN